MNKQRRQKIIGIIQNINQSIDELRVVRDDEESAFDNMPEGLQWSMRGEESQEAIDCMDNVIEQIEEAVEELREVL